MTKIHKFVEEDMLKLIIFGQNKKRKKKKKKRAESSIILSVLFDNVQVREKYIFLLYYGLSREEFV